MPKLLNAEDLLPFVALLTPRERDRLLRLIASGLQSDSSGYAAMPTGQDEFQVNDDLLSWDSEGWEQFS